MKSKESERQANKLAAEREKLEKIEAAKRAKAEKVEAERLRKEAEKQDRIDKANAALDARVALLQQHMDDTAKQAAEELKSFKEKQDKKDKLKDKKKYIPTDEAVVLCTKPDDKTRFKCTGPLNSMNGHAEDISGYRSPEEMVSKMMREQCPSQHPLGTSDGYNLVKNSRNSFYR